MVSVPKALRLHMDRKLKDIGLTTPQYAVLTSLDAEPGASNAALARRAFVTPQTMQAMLVKLERTSDREHGRIQRTALTATGSVALAKAHGIARSSERLLVKAVGSGRAEEIKAMLRNVAERLR